MGTKVNQYDVFWVQLDPVEGREMAKTRPCVVISPDEMNDYLNTVAIARNNKRNVCRIKI